MLSCLHRLVAFCVFAGLRRRLRPSPWMHLNIYRMICLLPWTTLTPMRQKRSGPL